MKNKLILMFGIVVLVFAGFVNAAITSITVVSPNGGENWTGIHAVTWTSEDCTGAENITITWGIKDGWAGWNPSSSGTITTTVNCSLGTYNWNTSSVSDGTNYKIRVSATADVDVFDISNAVFTINNTIPPDQPTLNSPINNSVVYGNRATLNITVTDDNDDYLNVSFYENVTCSCEGTGFEVYNVSGDIIYVDCNTDKCWTPTRSASSRWIHANSGCLDLTYGGSSDWTLPNPAVSQDLCCGGLCGKDCCEGVGNEDSTCTNDTDCGGTCFDTEGSTDWYWSTEKSSGYGYVVHFSDCYWSNSIKTGYHSYRCVQESGFENNTGNVINISNSSYATYDWTSLANGEHEWYASITDGTSTTTSSVYSFSIYDYNYTANHTTPVLETSSQTFTLNITRNSTYIDDGNATLHWNGTAYPVDATIYDTYLWFTKTLTMPSVSANTNITLNWSYEFWNPANNSRETNRTEDFTQLIYKIGFDDCSVYSIVALNFSLIEESNNASIAGDMDFTFSLVSEGTTLNYSKSVTGVNSTAFCISTGNLSFTAQLQSEYTSSAYDTFTYFAYNLAVTNTTQYITYYLTNGTTIVEFTVLDQNGDEVENAYIKVKKYDIGTGAYKTIETLKTDEQGKALGNIILDIAWYEFVIEYGGTVYLEDGPTKITTTSRTFRINLLSDFYERYTDVIYGITSSLSYTDATGNFRFTWSDPDGNYHYGCLKVTKESIAGNTLINDTCVMSTAGTILVNINSTEEVNGTYVAVGYIKFDEPYVLQVLRKTWGSLSETFGSEGLFYGFLIILTLAMVGVYAPKIAMILAVIGLIFSSILGFFNMNPSWIIALVIATGLTIYRMRDN